MIVKEELFKIGKIHKSHGFKGELSLFFDKPEYANVATKFFFLEIDSIFVPFLIEELTLFGNNRGHVKFEDIEDDTKASRYASKDMYVLRSELTDDFFEESTGWDFYIGYRVYEQNNKDLGVIIHVDTSTINTLFIVENEGGEHFIPATEDFIVEIDDTKKIIYMNLPEGLI